TVRQLRAKGLRPGGQDIAAQILWRRGRRKAYLYRIDLAAPKRPATAAQLAALTRAMRARRTCPTCRPVKDYYIPRRYGYCLHCLTEALAVLRYPAVFCHTCAGVITVHPTDQEVTP